MDHVTYSELRQNLATLMDKVCDDHAPLLVTRRNGRSVIMMSVDDYEEMDATTHLTRHPANVAWIEQSLADIEAGRVVFHGLIEPGDDK